MLVWPPDLARDMILKRLNREVGQVDGIEAVFPGALLGRLVRGRLLGQDPLPSNSIRSKAQSTAAWS
jgi:hypothetical protein